MLQRGVKLSPNQIRTIKNAKDMANLRLSRHALQGDIPIFVNQAQNNKFEKAIAKGTGLVLRLNKSNLKAIKGSGFWNDLSKGLSMGLNLVAPFAGAINPLAGQAASLGSNLFGSFAGNGVRASGIRASGVRAKGVSLAVRKKAKAKAAECSCCDACMATKKNDVMGQGLTFLR